MDKSLESKCHRLEEEYWWFIARRDMIFKLVKKLDKNSKILEIGCSGGVLIRSLKEHGFNNVYGIDISKDAVKVCKNKNIKNVFVMDGAKLKFHNEMFDVVITSDTLEHIKDENSALSEWNRVLKPGGKLIIFVPAFNFLWCSIDDINHHYRRYSKSALLNALKRSNFRIDRSSYWNFSLFTPVSLARLYDRFFLKNKKSNKDELYGVSPIANKLLIKLLKFENSLLTISDLPIGVSVFAVATKIR